MHIFTDGELLTADMINTYLLNNTEALQTAKTQLSNKLDTIENTLKTIDTQNLTILPPAFAGMTLKTWEIEYTHETIANITFKAAEIALITLLQKNYTLQHGVFPANIAYEKLNNITYGSLDRHGFLGNLSIKPNGRYQYYLSRLTSYDHYQEKAGKYYIKIMTIAKNLTIENPHTQTEL